jgi:hypothetical protein
MYEDLNLAWIDIGFERLRATWPQYRRSASLPFDLNPHDIESPRRIAILSEPQHRPAQRSRGRHAHAFAPVRQA